MRRRTKTLSMCGILAALAVALMFLGGVLPFASISCAMLASVVLIPAYAEGGWKWGALWYLTVAILGGLLAPEKEAAVLFAFFGYYPMLKKKIGHLRWKPAKILAKFLYLNAAVLAAYGLMIYVFQLEQVVQDFQQARAILVAGMLALANLVFFLYDYTIGLLEIVYHVRLRPKLKL